MCEYKVNWGEMWAAVNSEWTHSNLHLITEKRCAPIIAYRKVCEKKENLHWKCMTKSMPKTKWDPTWRQVTSDNRIYKYSPSTLTIMQHNKKGKKNCKYFGHFFVIFAPNVYFMPSVKAIPIWI